MSDKTPPPVLTHRSYHHAGVDLRDLRRGEGTLDPIAERALVDRLAQAKRGTGCGPIVVTTSISSPRPTSTPGDPRPVRRRRLSGLDLGDGDVR